MSYKIPSNELSRRERDVLQALWDSEGERKAIASSLNMALPTVACHLQGIFTKLDVKGRIGAIKKGIKLGLIELR